MRDYQRALSKIQSKLPACVCKTFHGSVITDVAARQDQVVLYFDNSESFSDVEKLVLYDADITCSEGDPVGKTWLHEEVSLADGAFCLAALLGDEQGELYEFTVRCMAETLESITALCAEEAGLDYDAPTPEALEKFLQGIGGYKIAEENLYRFEAGVFNQACEEFYELLFTRRVCARSGNWELTICFYYPPEAQLEEYSDLVCADDPDSFVKEVLASEALQTVLTRYKPMRVRVHAEQV
ncbi:MAG: hypothetical protein BHV98_05675 [Clostridium sp. CAG:217_53_7]|nr:MAG: hypothetical protein BHV98_05675 [Clostridium sp. CAG:217_53_7]